MRSCQYIVNIALVTYRTDAMESNFDAGVGIDVGVDFYFHIVSDSSLQLEARVMFIIFLFYLPFLLVSWHVHPHRCWVRGR
jgi:hypothetical protein